MHCGVHPELLAALIESSISDCGDDRGFNILERLDGWTDRWTDGWLKMDIGWLVGWMGGGMDGWMDQSMVHGWIT